MAFDANLITSINENVKDVLDDVANKHSNLSRDHATDAYVLLKYGVLAWKGDGHGAMNVLQQVATGASNMSRDNAGKALAAMKGGTLSIVAG